MKGEKGVDGFYFKFYLQTRVSVSGLGGRRKSEECPALKCNLEELVAQPTDRSDVSMVSLQL